MKPIFILVLTCCTFAHVIDGDREFIRSIECVPLPECPTYLRLLKRPVTTHSIATIRAANCGFDRLVEKVWCPLIRIDAATNDTLELLPKSNVVELEKNNTIDVVETDGAEIGGNGLQPMGSENSTEVNDTSTHSGTVSNMITKFPGESVCGRHVENKVFGGQETEIDEFPWTAMLKYRVRRNNQYVYEPGCGGSLINHRYIVTAAHCASAKNIPSMIVLGEYDVRNETDCIHDFEYSDCAPKPLVVGIENITVHPGWFSRSRPFYDDIALIRLDRDVDFNDFVAPICLMDHTIKMHSRTRLAVAGWGLTEKRTPSPVKLKVSVPFVDQETCTKRLVLPRPLKNGQICAGGEKDKDTCKGDSGGPLMYFDGNTQAWRLAGVVSFGAKRCGVDRTPAIYTWVPHYLDWIYDNVY